MNLLDQVKITGMAGSTKADPASSTFLNMSGWDGCLFLMVGTSQITSTGTAIIQQATGTSTAGAYASTFSNGLAFAAGVQNIIAIDVVRPLRQYLRLSTLTCTGVNVIAIQHSPRRAGSTEARVNLKTMSGVHVCTS
jgi:hypothetical protein